MSFYTEIRAEQLTKQFDHRIVLRNINLDIRAGDLVCIVGASGSGKTVLLDHLIGLIAPSSGRVLAADHNVAVQADGTLPLRELGAISEEELDLIRLYWAVVFQRNALFSGTVRENIALWLQEHTILDDQSINERIRWSLASVGLDVNGTIDKDRESLSGGMAKRVAIARAIACDPLVIFYDEPTTGLDPMAGSKIHELIETTHRHPLGPGFVFKDLGEAPPVSRVNCKRTTIIVTHDRDLLRRIRPRVIMLHDAQICFDGSYDDFASSALPPARAYLAEMPVLQSRLPAS